MIDDKEEFIIIDNVITLEQTIKDIIFFNIRLTSDNIIKFNLNSDAILKIMKIRSANAKKKYYNEKLKPNEDFLKNNALKYKQYYYKKKQEDKDFLSKRRQQKINNDNKKLCQNTISNNLNINFN